MNHVVFCTITKGGKYIDLYLNKFSISVPINCTVPELQNIIATQESIPVEKQRIIYKGKVLKTDKDVKFYNIEDGDALHLIVRADDAPPIMNDTSNNNPSNVNN